MHHRNHTVHWTTHRLHDIWMHHRIGRIIGGLSHACAVTILRSARAHASGKDSDNADHHGGFHFHWRPVHFSSNPTVGPWNQYGHEDRLLVLVVLRISRYVCIQCGWIAFLPIASHVHSLTCSLLYIILYDRFTPWSRIFASSIVSHRTHQPPSRGVVEEDKQIQNR